MEFPRMTTRRNILKGGAGLAAILASGKAPAYIVKSMLAARNSIGTRVGGAKLPYDAEVEWLKSVNGDGYIDTGLTVNDFYLSIKTLTTNVGINTVYMFGAGDKSSGIMMYRPGRYPTAQKRIYIDGSLVFNNEKEPTEISDLHITASSLSHTLVLFNTRASDGSVHSGNGGFTCYYLTIKDANGNKLREFIPVRFTNELGQSEGAMYDRVSEQLFRNAGTGSFVIGPDIVPVEYIESTGAEWIDTRFKANTGTTSFEISLTQKNINQYPQGLFGSRNTTYASNSSFNAFMMSGGDVRADFVGLARNLDSGMTDNSLFVIRYDNRRVYVNGVSDILSYAENSTLQDYNFLVGSFTNGGDTPYSNGFVGLVHYVKLWSSGVLVRDLIPVRVGSGSTWEGAMMDVLTRRVYRNAGTGAFGYGNDLKYPIPAE